MKYMTDGVLWGFGRSTSDWVGGLGELGLAGSGSRWFCVLVTVRLLLLGSMGVEKLATAARGKWPNVNSSFWR